MTKALIPAAGLTGRLLLAALFLHEGWAKLGGYGAAVTYMEAYGVPGMLLPGTIALELGGGLLLAVGLLTRWAAAAFAVFCVAAALLFHSRFGAPGQLLHFEKDLAIAGGFLLLAVHGPGGWSLDSWLLHRRHPPPDGG